ncbi:MAG TPA: hypothetical protein VLB29_07040 [Nocardioidaceae bacterium]|nr:hypothetical protein [Nocardioidaceae bacterium]
MPARRSVRILLFGAALALLLAVGLGLYALRDSRARVIDESTDATGWKTLEYEGVRVNIPSDWERLDMGGCDFRFERWAPQGVSPCDPDAEGVAFYGSATFDPDLGPGVIRNDGEDPKIPGWEGYVYAGEFAVHASSNDRAVVEGILDSAK